MQRHALTEPPVGAGRGDDLHGLIHRLGFGRIDMKAHRDRDRLSISGFWPERGLRWSNARQARLEAELGRAARLAGVGETVFENGWKRQPG
jgi:uncharacterized protein YcaQ